MTATARARMDDDLKNEAESILNSCLLYTSDAADE